jgi:aspartate racemase
MRTIGVIGGIAPESTIEYYRLIVTSYRDRVRDGTYPPIIINSIDMKKMLDLIGANDLVGVTGYLLGEVEKLARAGAEVGFLASNTPHIVFEQIQRGSPLPLISIVEAACEATKALGVRKAGLFGTRFTMQGGFYPAVFEREDIALVTPTADEQAYIHDKYMGELVNGVFRTETRARLLAIADRMIDHDGIGGLVLGGTELPLILTSPTYRDIPLIDTTRVHAERVISEMLR